MSVRHFLYHLSIAYRHFHPLDEHSSSILKSSSALASSHHALFLSHPHAVFSLAEARARARVGIAAASAPLSVQASQASQASQVEVSRDGRQQPLQPGSAAAKVPEPSLSASSSHHTVLAQVAMQLEMLEQRCAALAVAEAQVASGEFSALLSRIQHLKRKMKLI